MDRGVAQSHVAHRGRCGCCKIPDGDGAILRPTQHKLAICGAAERAEHTQMLGAHISAAGHIRDRTRLRVAACTGLPTEAAGRSESRPKANAATPLTWAEGKLDGGVAAAYATEAPSYQQQLGIQCHQVTHALGAPARGSNSSDGRVAAVTSSQAKLGGGHSTGTQGHAAMCLARCVCVCSQLSWLRHTHTPQTWRPLCFQLLPLLYPACLHARHQTRSELVRHWQQPARCCWHAHTWPGQ